MQIRCYRCGWSFAIKKDEAAFALQALEETGGSHYDTSCPNCRHSNRVSLEQLRKAAPRTAQEPEAVDAAPETEGVLEDQSEADAPSEQAVEPAEGESD